MKRYIILSMFCLLALTNAAASNTTYIIEPIMIGTNHFEQDPGKRHAPPRQVILSVEQEENVFIIRTSFADSIGIYFTDSTNEILYASQSTPNNEHGHELGSEHLAQHWLATEQILQIAIYISLRKVIERLGQINYSLVQGVTVIND